MLAAFGDSQILGELFNLAKKDRLKQAAPKSLCHALQPLLGEVQKMNEEDIRRLLRKLLASSAALRSLLRVTEYLMFGTVVRERILIALLSLYYRSRFRRSWYWTKGLPHFSDSRFGAFKFAFDPVPGGALVYYRAFLALDVISQEDSVLDIGCGDGFLTKRFFATRCTHVDAIDIDPDAINAAIIYNSAPNIKYHLTDAVAQQFPAEKYNVIVWNGAIAYFPPEPTTSLLQKISSSLSDDGIFVGAESLGRAEGHDHLQFFETLQDLHRLFSQHFEFVSLRTATYRAGVGRTFTRREAYWRCAHKPTRIKQSPWLYFQANADRLG
jgi:SAM-dependent methyltransferase